MGAARLSACGATSSSFEGGTERFGNDLRAVDRQMVFIEIKRPTCRLDLASPGAAQRRCGIERREAMSSSRVLEQDLDTMLSLAVLVERRPDVDIAPEAVHLRERLRDRVADLRHSRKDEYLPRSEELKRSIEAAREHGVIAPDVALF